MEQRLRPICFMVMPYGKKDAQTAKGTITINFDALWHQALFPLIEELGYYAIRADQDMGALIIHEMIERLTMADLIIADLTIPNGNVYYEIGVRHAAKETGCVLISADWAQPLFDVAQMRQVRYPLPAGEVTPETAAAIREALQKGVGPLATGKSPVFESIPGFPGKIDMKRASSFRDQIERLSKFSTELHRVRLETDERRQAATQQLLAEYRDAAQKLPGVALELIYLLRDSTHWESVVEFINTLPAATQQLPVVKEQLSLAKSKNGNHLEAIAALQELISLNGDSAERRGLLGGRYKKLYVETKLPQHLDRAIAEYDKGMRLDLNNYYPSSNLPRLLRKRGRAGDAAKAQTAAAVAVLACERARALNAADEWLLPTLLGMAFEAGDVEKVQALYEEMSATSVQPFQLETTVADLKLSVELQQNETIAAQLRAQLDAINALIPAK